MSEINMLWGMEAWFLGQGLRAKRSVAGTMVLWNLQILQGSLMKSKQRPRTASVSMFTTENSENPEKHHKVNTKTCNPPHCLYSYSITFKNWHHVIANSHFYFFHVMSWELTQLKCRRWRLSRILYYSIQRGKYWFQISSLQNWENKCFKPLPPKKVNTQRYILLNCGF